MHVYNSAPNNQGGFTVWLELSKEDVGHLHHECSHEGGIFGNTHHFNQTTPETYEVDAGCELLKQHITNLLFILRAASESPKVH